MKFTSCSTITASLLLLATLKPREYGGVSAQKATISDHNHHRKTSSSDDERRYIVKFRKQQNATLTAGSGYRLQKDDPRLIMVLPEDDAEVITIDTEEDLMYWENHEDVEYVEQDSKVYPHQFFLNGESTPWGIERVGALDVSDDNVYNQKVCM